MFQIHRSSDGKWFWTLQDQGNNETLCQSETYNSKESARIGITAAISAPTPCILVQGDVT